MSSRDMRSGDLLWGLVLIVVGVALLAERYNWFGMGFHFSLGQIWPIFLVIIGLVMILRHR